jgi:hypothetical protein
MEPREIPDRPDAPGETELRLVQLVVRALEEAPEHPKLVQDLHRRGMDSISAKIAEEVGVLFEHLRLAAGTGEQ